MREDPVAGTDLSKLYKGLQIAKGDQLIDVLQIWDYRVRKDFDRKDYDRILRYSVNLVPEIVAIIENDETDVELRAIAAEIMVNFILIFDKIRDSEGIPTAQITRDLMFGGAFQLLHAMPVLLSSEAISLLTASYSLSISPSSPAASLLPLPL